MTDTTAAKTIAIKDPLADLNIEAMVIEEKQYGDETYYAVEFEVNGDNFKIGIIDNGENLLSQSDWQGGVSNYEEICDQSYLMIVNP